MTNLPKISKKTRDSNIMITELSIKIQEIIDEICKENNYEIPYIILNLALLKVLQDHQNYELKEYNKGD